MSNGANLESWVKDIDNKLDTACETLVRVETHLDSGHIKFAQQDADISELKKEMQGLRENNAFMRGQIHMIMLIGGALVGIGVILQAIATFVK